MARPKIKDSVRKKIKVTVRFDESEHEKLRGESEKIGVTVSEFVREKTLKGYVRVPRYARLDVKQVDELSRLGGLAKKIHNESGHAYAPITAETLEHINAILSLMEKEVFDDRQTHTEQNQT
jgi:hypothetical protein